MQVPKIVNDPSKVQLSRFSHVYFQHPNLERFREFAKDFGFVEVENHGSHGTIYFRGYGVDQYLYVVQPMAGGTTPTFKGPAFVAASRAEFDKATALPGAQHAKLDNAPGGGEQVTFARDDDTYFHVVYGMKPRTSATDDSSAVPSATHEKYGPFNLPLVKPRKGSFQRFHAGPALVHKIGHLGYVHRNFDSELAWYTDNFNFVPSDILYAKEAPEIDVLTFFHLDLGKEYSDHHCLFLSRAPHEVTKSYLHHTSYEVADFDTQLLGHEWLAARGWRNVWGVGRHVLGSQIFDYWQDPSGFKIEHYADGDVVNEGTEPRRDTLGPLSVWGPELPKDFGDDATKTL